MRHITKNQSPAIFEQWKEQHKEEIENCSLDWEEFGSKYGYENARLRESLAEEQGHICCYCGQDISPESGKSTTIEHFKPKGVYKNLTFDYQNLMLSCKGSQDKILFSILFKETLGYENLDTLNSIAQKIGIESIMIRKANPLLATKDPRKPITELQKGEVLHFYPRHCDDKKEDKDNLIINPLNEAEIKWKFIFQENGEIALKDTDPITTENILFSVLNLNIPSLVFLRKRAYETANFLLAALLKDITAQTISDDEFLFELNHQEAKDSNGRRKEFCFIYSQVFQKQS